MSTLPTLHEQITGIRATPPFRRLMRSYERN